MLVSFSHGFYFLKPAKCAGTTIECVLGQLCQEKNDIYTKFRKSEDIDKQYRQGEYQKPYDENFKEHTNYKELTEKIDVSGLYPIIVIRHPYEICASEVAWSGRGIRQYNTNGLVDYKSDSYIRWNFDKRFTEALCNGFDHENLLKHHLEIYRQYEFYGDAIKHPNLYTIRFSNLKEDLSRLCKKYKISPQIPHTKQTGCYNANQVHNILKPNQLELIQLFFKNDFEQWKWQKLYA